MAVRSRRVAGPTLVGTSSTVVYTVPAGRTLVLHGIALINTTGGTVTGQWGINGTAAGSMVEPLFSRPATTVGIVPEPQCPTLNPGDTFDAKSSVAAGFYVLLWGSLLDGAPS